MAHQPHELAKFASKVYEVERGVPLWSLGDPNEGIVVGGRQGRRLAELTASFFFVLPNLSWKSGLVNLLTLARGVPGETGNKASFWDPIELSTVNGGVYAHVTYDPGREEFRVTMNAGGVTRELLGVTLKAAAPDLVCGRVLQFYAEINEDRIFASVKDFLEGGDLSLDGVAPSTGTVERPWGRTSAGNWWLLTGIDESNSRAARLPVGTAMSGLRITFGSETNEFMASLPYDRSLDHLTDEAAPTVLSKEFRELLRQAAKLRKTAKDFEEMAALLGTAEASGAGEAAA